jgi:hypothetical protein
MRPFVGTEGGNTMKNGTVVFVHFPNIFNRVAERRKKLNLGGHIKKSHVLIRCFFFKSIPFMKFIRRTHFFVALSFHPFMINAHPIDKHTITIR